MHANDAKDLLSRYEKERSSYESQDQQEILIKNAKRNIGVLQQMNKEFHDFRTEMLKISIESIKYQTMIDMLENAINSKNSPKEVKKQSIDKLKDEDAKSQLQDLYRIRERINKHVSRQEDLQRSVCMLEKVIADTKRYQNSGRERIEGDYQDFTHNIKKQLYGFKEARDLYLALIDGKKNNVSNEDMKANIAGEITKARICKEVV